MPGHCILPRGTGVEAADELYWEGAKDGDGFVLVGKVHVWKQKPEWFSIYSTQMVGTKWVCDRCGKESDEDPRR